MTQKFLIKLSISLVALAIGFNGFCLQIFTGPNFQAMPLARAMAMETNQGCAGQKSIDANMNCCLSSHQSAEAKSIMSAKTGESPKKTFFTQNLFQKVFFSELAFNSGGNTIYRPPDGHKISSTLTGIVVKKE